MAERYTIGFIPEEYNQAVLIEEFTKVMNALRELEPSTIILVPQNVAPDKPQEGMIAVADGTNWNPGSGAGIYEYVSGAWSKL